MALKFRITKSAFDKLDDATKEHYEADGDKHYKLEVDGIEDTAELKRAKDREKERADELAEELKSVKKEKKTLEDAAGEGGADVQRLTRSHERKVATLTEEHNATLAGRDSFIRETLIDGQALTLATEISTVPSIMADHVKKRLDVDFTGEKPKLVIKDKDGKPAPALKLADLKTELLTTAGLKPILVGSKASGSGAQKTNLPAGNSSAAPQGNANQTADVNAMSPGDFVAKVRASREAAGKTGEQQAA